jgi:hypothetical protein
VLRLCSVVCWGVCWVLCFFESFVAFAGKPMLLDAAMIVCLGDFDGAPFFDCPQSIWGG